MECGRGLETVINLSKKWLIMPQFIGFPPTNATQPSPISNRSAIDALPIHGGLLRNFLLSSDEPRHHSHDGCCCRPIPLIVCCVNPPGYRLFWFAIIIDSPIVVRPSLGRIRRCTQSVCPSACPSHPSRCSRDRKGVEISNLVETINYSINWWSID